MDMQAFAAYSSSSSSSSSTFLARNVPRTDQSGPVKQEFPNYSHLHSVRKPMAKPWKKPAVAPMPPTRPRVYKVDAINFRNLVQKLTGFSEFQAPRLQNMAPPPLDIARRQGSSATADATQLQPSPVKLDNASDDGSFLEWNMSPFTKNWCSFPLLSPETLAILDAI